MFESDEEIPEVEPAAAEIPPIHDIPIFQEAEVPVVRSPSPRDNSPPPRVASSRAAIVDNFVPVDDVPPPQLVVAFPPFRPAAQPAQHTINRINVRWPGDVDFGQARKANAVILTEGGWPIGLFVSVFLGAQHHGTLRFNLSRQLPSHWTECSRSRRCLLPT